jgi:hypothetical protein
MVPNSQLPPFCTRSIAGYQTVQQSGSRVDTAQRLHDACLIELVPFAVTSQPPTASLSLASKPSEGRQFPQPQTGWWMDSLHPQGPSATLPRPQSDHGGITLAVAAAVDCPFPSVWDSPVVTGRIRTPLGTPCSGLLTCRPRRLSLTFCPERLHRIGCRHLVRTQEDGWLEHPASGARWTPQRACPWSMHAPPLDSPGSTAVIESVHRDRARSTGDDVKGISPDALGEKASIFDKPATVLHVDCRDCV